jgi:hypothetical protein
MDERERHEQADEKSQEEQDQVRVQPGQGARIQVQPTGSLIATVGSGTGDEDADHDDGAARGHEQPRQCPHRAGNVPGDGLVSGVTRATVPAMMAIDSRK